uniref:Uncharacterized protein n=1 Tax=Medicago truncatula TaxID=3880 RepID=I3SER3_MEDTR|nr:unknown [Medicago truncatula]
MSRNNSQQLLLPNTLFVCVYLACKKSLI